MQTHHLIIGGELVAGARAMDVINPATGQSFATCPCADEVQLNQAVSAAQAAFATWGKTTIEARRALLMEIADALEPQTQEIARLLTAEQGKPLADATQEVAISILLIRFLASLDFGIEVLKDDASGKVVSHRTPLGVVAAITPWNFPVMLFVVKAIPALLAGNTLVAKPAPTTPLTTLVIGRTFNQILPPGVFNVITDQNDLGGLLTAHPGVAKVSFTGSTATGRKVMAAGASTLKRITLELGGNDAAIVLEGVDPKEVAPKLFQAAMINTGQVCAAVKRVYVPEAMYDEVCDELATLANAAVVGDGMTEGTQFGPLQNVAQYEKVMGFIAEARVDGRIIAGGIPVDGPGYFVRPTIVRDISDQARLVQEEQFGPVLPVLKYKDIDEVISRVNDTPYGLCGSVWSVDQAQGLDVAMKIDSGLIWVNQFMVSDPGLPSGGAKQSGIGREFGLEGLYEFTQAHIIYAAA